MEELLLDMKSDVSKLSLELTKIPSVSKQLKIDELSILGKLAGKDPQKPATIQVPTVPQPSVITQSKLHIDPANKSQTDPTSVSVATSGSELVILANTSSSTATSGLQFIQQKPQTTSASQYAALTQYVADTGTTLLVPATQSTLGQQVLYWAPGQVVQSSQATLLAQAATPGIQTLSQSTSQKKSSGIQYIKTNKTVTDSSGKIIQIE